MSNQKRIQYPKTFVNSFLVYVRFKLSLISIVIVAFFLHFFSLDLKLFHHDEAIHSWFSYNLLTTGSWAYDPSYHGPFLYYVTAGMFSLFGASDLVARILPALFGFLLIPLIYAIYRLGYLNRGQTLIASLFVAISPDLVYFSRFLRHDIFMLFFTLLLLVAILAYLDRGQTRYAIIAGLAAAGGMALKEEMPVILIIFASFFLIALWKKKWTLPAQWKKDVVLSAAIAGVLLATLYSSFWFHPQTLVGDNFQLGLSGIHFQANTTGWYQAVDHWIAMHDEQRLGGPWFFYIPLFLLYELPIFILAIVGTSQFIVKDVPLTLYLRRCKNWLRTRKFEIPASELASTVALQLRCQRTGSNKTDDFFRFCIWWMLLTMAFYAYVGEKVPWLLIHQLLPMCFVAVYKLNWQKVAFALLGCVFLIVMTWHVAFIPADISEPIVQVQNSEDMREVMGLMDNSSVVVIASSDYWPLPWYYRGDTWLKKIVLYGNSTDVDTLTQKNPGVIILHDTESYPSIAGYQKKTYKLDYWFSFDDNENRLPEYYLHRDGTLGSINIDVFTPLPSGSS